MSEHSLCMLFHVEALHFPVSDPPRNATCFFWSVTIVFAVKVELSLDLITLKCLYSIQPRNGKFMLRVAVTLKNWVLQMLCCHTSMSLHLTSWKLVNLQAAAMSLKMKKLAYMRVFLILSIGKLLSSWEGFLVWNLWLLTGLVLLQPLRWCCVDCVIHHERDVREEQHHTYMWREQATIEWSWRASSADINVWTVEHDD